jgi:quercetin dioxygenase-like cupin family protein
MTHHETDGVTDLDEMGSDLLGQARSASAGRAAATVLSGTSMRATVIALTEGTELAEHDAPPAATLQVLSGTVRLHADTDEWTLTAGQIAPIPPRRHGLAATTDAVVLLTVSLH